MASETKNQKLIKRRLGICMRMLAGISFVVLVIAAINSFVSAMTLDTIANENGIPSAWHASSLGEPETITLPITYWDQKADDCNYADRQFEWTECSRYRTHGVLSGIVKNTLGADRLPIPAFSTADASWSALHDALSINVIGHDPVQPSDNFYRWFHEVPGLSKRIDGRTVTFRRLEKGVYEYGGQDIYPIDDVPGIDASDVKLKDWQGDYHNFNFTAHLGFSIKVDASSREVFQFSGDDDVWVFLNNKLVLDIGGLHGPINGWFQINADGTVTTFVEKVNNLAIRSGDWVECMRIHDAIYANDSCIGTYNTKIRQNFSDITTENLDFGLKSGDVVNLDFYYAERSTDGSNTKITINHMNWPISADSKIETKVAGKLNDTDNKLIEFNTYVKNRDPEFSLDLERLAAYIEETTSDGVVTNGFLPLDKTSLYYTTTPDDDKSWQPVDIAAPDNSDDGFVLATPLHMAPAGQAGDTLYFRYYGETSTPAGEMSSTISYYTALAGNAGVTYDRDSVEYVITTAPDKPNSGSDTNPEPSPDPKPDIEPKPTPEPNDQPSKTPTPSTTPTDALPTISTFPNPSSPDQELIFVAPLGEVALIPNTGVINSAGKGLFEQDFAEVVLSQGSIMVALLVFAGSFSIWFSLRKYVNLNFAKRNTNNIISSSHNQQTTMRNIKSPNTPKMNASRKTSRTKATCKAKHAKVARTTKKSTSKVVAKSSSSKGKTARKTKK